MDNDTSTIANLQIQLARNLAITRYSTVAGLVLVMYDATITIDDEVSGFRTNPFKLHSFPGGSRGLARAIRSFEATLLPQPVLDNCFLDSCQLSCVTCTPGVRLKR
jgi:hypothetical protein